jgi:hypothetical protein
VLFYVLLIPVNGWCFKDKRLSVDIMPCASNITGHRARLSMIILYPLIVCELQDNRMS